MEWVSGFLWAQHALKKLLKNWCPVVQQHSPPHPSWCPSHGLQILCLACWIPRAALLSAPGAGCRIRLMVLKALICTRDHQDCQTEDFQSRGALAQVAQRNGGCPIPADTQGQTGWSSEQQMELWVSVHCRGVGPDGLQRLLPTQMILQFQCMWNNFKSL